MRPSALLALLLAAIAPLSGCGKFHESKMVDPRTGIAAFCRSERFNLFTTAQAVQSQRACEDELGYYGFRDEERLKTAATPPPTPTEPLAMPQPLPYLPPQGGRRTVPEAYAPPVYSGPVNPSY